MSLEPKPPPFHEIADPEDRLAAFFKWAADYCTEQQAQNPSPEPSPEPWVDKPGTLIAAERAVFHLEMILKLQPALCGDAGRCENHRCRRGRQCSKLEVITANMAAARAHLAAEWAKLKLPPAPPEPPRKRRKGRTGVRP
jgi:hypothetical protein